MKHSPSSILPLALTLLLPLAAYAGGGHDHGDEPQPAPPSQSGPLRLTLSMTRNLGLETAEAVLRPFEKTFSALGHIEADPASTVAVSTRISGRVTALHVHEGARVRAGASLLALESRIVADPPPSIVLSAPRDAHVLELRARVGDPVEPQSALMILADLSVVHAVAQLPESQLARVAPGQKVLVRPHAFPGEVFSGQVLRTAAAADRASGTVRVFVEIKNPDGKLLPGLRASFAFVAEEVATSVIVPRSAILGEGGDLFVFRQLTTAPFAYERTTVETGLRDSEWVEIIHGVLPGDHVVTKGNYQLQFVGGGAAKLEDDHDHGPGGHQH